MTKPKQLTNLQVKTHKMKNLLFTLTLLFSVHSFSQDFSHSSNPVSDVIVLLGIDYQGVENAAIVPEGKYWTFNRHQNTAWLWQTPNGNEENNYWQVAPFGTTLPAGYKVFYPTNAQDYGYIMIYEHNLISDSSMGYNDFEPYRDRIKLFPNPTTSEVALNSDKDYQIEVYDLLGNKVMELTGNTIDMEHLSRATYIVNALDLETQESLSYKIIKK